MKKNPISLLLLSCLFSLLTLQGRAAGIAGGYIDYSCLGNERYDIWLHVIVDCNSNLSFNKTLMVTPSCGSVSPFSVPLFFQDSVDRTQLCKSRCTRCGDPQCPQPYGFKEYVLTASVDLSQANCNEWTFSWQESQRSSAITTVSANQGIYLYATVNKFLAPCNFTSELRPLPSTLICSGKCFGFNDDALDPEGDSLVYTLVSAKSSATENVTYNAPYSSQAPLYFDGFPNASLPFNSPDCKGFHLLSSPGVLLFKPMKEEGALVSYKIEEFRNGKKIAERIRELPIVAIPCDSNNPPTVSGINGGSSYYAQALPGQTLSFTINSDDVDGDTVTMKWNGGIPGANFTVGSGRTPTGTFSWTPKEKDPSKIPYFFTVSVTDDACPFPSTTIRSFRILINPLATAEYEVVNLGFGEYEFRITKLDPPDAYVNWEIKTLQFSTDQKTFKYTFPAEGKYTFSLRISTPDHARIYYDTLDVKFGVGMKESLSTNPNIHLFPNPAKGHAVLVFDRNEFASTTVELISPDGRVINTWKQENPGELRISRNDLAKGIYLLRLRNNSGQSWQAKLVFE